MIGTDVSEQGAEVDTSVHSAPTEPRDARNNSPPASTPGSRRLTPVFWERSGVCCLLLLLFGLCARLPALQGELLWDDHALVASNPMIRSPLLSLEAFRHYLFPDVVGGHYRPVQTVSYIFDYWWWNLDPLGFHLASICWHLASGVLLYFLLRMLVPLLLSLNAPGHPVAPEKKVSSIAAFLVALLWIVHPVHSAAVDYISGRADSLAFVFAAGAWLLYLRARDTSGTSVRRGFFVLAGISALLALCSRESGFMWMLIFLLYVFCLERRTTSGGKLVVLATCLAISATYLALRHLPASSPHVVSSVSSSAATTAVLMLRALGDYTRLMFVPTNLHVERTVAGPAPIDYLAIAGVLSLCALLYGATRKGPGRPARIAGASWFIITYLPISNIVPLNATIAEHWLYLPSVGFLIFLAGVVVELPFRFKRVAVAAASVAVLAFTARSAIRSSDWVDPETFFRRTFAAGGTDSRIGANLGVIYALRGDHAAAENILRKVLEASPNYSLARNNLGLALAQQGKTEEAEAFFKSATAVEAASDKGRDPTWDAALHLARSRYAQKDTAAALAIVAEARRKHPHIWPLARAEAEMLQSTGDGDAALARVQEFVDRHWWHAAASMTLGRIHLAKEDFVRADAAFRHASWLDVYDAESVGLRSLIKLKENRLDEASRLQRRAVARKPYEPRQYLILADLLTKMGRHEDAAEVLGEVAQMQALAAANLGRE